LKDQRITITPIQFDLTCHEELERLRFGRFRFEGLTPEEKS
jgi:hypothetical protein